MPRKGRPATSGYARIAQAEEEQQPDDYRDDSGDEQAGAALYKSDATDTRYEAIQPARVAGMPSSNGGGSGGGSGGGEGSQRRSRHRRQRTNSGVDIKAINARLERWAEEIAAKFKMRMVKGKSAEEERLEIHHSVFQAPDGMRPATAESLAARFAASAQPHRMTDAQFDEVVESVQVAIEQGVHPKMISQGSSGSYFARNSQGKTVGVFKPKDEEPYASRNPKWTKWIHRNLFPFFFGRACLIPNLSYVSEAAAYILDTRLQTNLVPYTGIVRLSSVSFFYDFWERRAYYRKRRPFPAKVGSFQVFLQGFKDANVFLREHPWPDQTTANLPANSADRRRRRRSGRGWTDSCRTGAAGDDDDDDAEEEQTEEGELRPATARSESQRRREFWTEDVQTSFREELEKLVILDYIMRNTDRGLDNWMVRIDEETRQASIVAEFADEPESRDEDMATSSPPPPTPAAAPTGPANTARRARVGAIDNSLSWPWKHPDAWRSFPFGWLFLPVSLIGRPFSERTRQHFLPLLTSKQWWSETQVALRRCFSQDSDFQERMFARQIAVMKGQAWNVVETLKTPDHGPLELTRRARVCVWDDLVEIPTVVPLRTSSELRTSQPGFEPSPAESHLAAQLSANTSVSDMPTPNRFNMSRQTSEQKITSAAATAAVVSPPLSNLESRFEAASRPSTAPRSKTRFSLDEPRPSRPLPRRPRRNLSFSARQTNRDAEEDDSGDLGYGAARDMEGNRRKVIVERLETVKGKPPVFTWC